MFSRSGDRPPRVPCYGFMASVSVFLVKVTPFLGLMYFYFVAGAGKTVLWYVELPIFSSLHLRYVDSSAVIRNLDAMRKAGLASLVFFYCDFREDKKKNLRGLLSSLLAQLCHQSDSYCKILSSFYSKHGSGWQHASDDALVECLKDLLKLPGQAPVYLVVDALDECPITADMPSPREEVMNLIHELLKSDLPNLRICVISRPETDVKAVLDPLTSYSISLHSEKGQMRDIDNYIRFVVKADPMMQRWNARDKQLVIDVLTKRADGM